MSCPITLKIKQRSSLKFRQEVRLLSAVLFLSPEPFLCTNYVIEIINGHSITPIPMIPSFIKGILNLRGQILPVVDIRLYMGHEEMEFTRQTCIIVLQVDSLSLGIIVDSVQQVIDIDLANVRSIPVKRQQKLLDGMVTLEDGRVLMSFDCNALINDPC